MKTAIKLIITLIVLSFSTAACTQSRYATDQFDITEFSSIESSIVGNINIRQGQTTNVTAEGSEEILDILEVKIENGTLFLDMEERLLKRFKRSANKLTVSITTPDLTYIDSEGVGNIVIEGTFKTTELTINSSGVGNITAENIRAEYIKIDSEGVGNIILGGTADNVDINSVGVGNVEADRLKAKSAFVSSEGVGNVSCFATEYVKASSDGIGNVTYYGKPRETDLSKNGIGKVKSGD
ncbi:MAG: DUF2807 domain-containing protein [Fermentimonas sp.]|nr:DUF2807 domain-containing protein [Fermentimonas sp.]